MTSKAFQQGFVALTAAFPGLQFNSDLFWRTLNDLDGQFFLEAVIDIIRNTKEFFPGSNVIAILRSRAEELRIEALKNSTLKLVAETEKERVDRWSKEAAPMPEDCRSELIKKGLLEVEE